MANFNRVILVGNLTRDVESRATQGGTSVAKFGLAINRKYKVDDETKETTCFVDCVAWGRAGEVIAEYVGKGDSLLVDGRLDYQSWEAADGSKRSKLEVVVENFQLMGGSRKSESASKPAPRKAPAPSPPPPAEYDDIPF